MDRLTDAVECLDGPLDDPIALADNLRDLRRMNRWLGGVALSSRAIEALAAHRSDLAMLDVGTGGADIPLALLADAGRRGRTLHVVGLDSRPEVLAAAPRALSAVASTPGLTLTVGDGRSLPYPDRAFDIVHASLVLHHLDPAGAAALLGEMRRVARLGIVVNDLERSRLAWLGAWLLGHLFTGNRYTRHDAPLSVRRSYRSDEAVALVRAAGLAPVRTIRGGPFRLRYAIAAVRPTEPDAPGAGGWMAATERVEVAIVGGGPAGATLAARLARAGHEVVVLERAPAWHWRAGGVFASPASVVALRDVGLAATTLAAVARPIPAMRVETPAGTTFRLTYGVEDGGEPAVGFDRSHLDPALVELARAAGALVKTGWAVVRVDPERGRLDLRGPDGPASMEADVVVGADGLRSAVARAARVDRPARLTPRLGLTYHLADPARPAPRDARMRIVRDGYIGIAPVPGDRVNVGIVLGRSWQDEVARDGARAVSDRIVNGIPAADDDAAGWRDGAPLDAVAGAWPIGHRVTRRAGRRWLLIGDAAGFLDPFTGEGLHRALVSAELAAAAIAARSRGGRSAFDAYERAMTRRFMTKDAVSWLVQAFLTRPAWFEYAARRVASRASVRATMGLVMGDLVPAGRALDPRYLAALLAP